MVYNSKGQTKMMQICRAFANWKTWLTELLIKTCFFAKILSSKRMSSYIWVNVAYFYWDLYEVKCVTTSRWYSLLCKKQWDNHPSMRREETLQLSCFCKLSIVLSIFQNIVFWRLDSVSIFKYNLLCWAQSIELVPIFGHLY
jgi:hypothetical protein